MYQAHRVTLKIKNFSPRFSDKKMFSFQFSIFLNKEPYHNFLTYIFFLNLPNSANITLKNKHNRQGKHDFQRGGDEKKIHHPCIIGIPEAL